jgi:hypothetical protein
MGSKVVEFHGRIIFTLRIVKRKRLAYLRRIIMKKVLCGAASLALLALLGCNRAPNAPNQANAGTEGSAMAALASTSAMAGSVMPAPATFPLGVSTNNNKRIYAWGQWVSTNAPISAISVSGKYSALWYVSMAGVPYQWVSGTGWVAHLFPTGILASDIGAGTAVYATSTTGTIYKWNGSAWVLIQGLAQRIDCDENGRVWCVNSSGIVYELTSGGWTSRDGITAQDIGIGGGAAYAVDMSNNVYKWTGTSWTPFDIPSTGGGCRIAVDQYGSPWIAGVNTYEYYPGRGWLVRGGANDIACVNPSNAYAVGTDKGVYQWSGWSLSGNGAGDLIALSGKTCNKMWAISSTGVPWQFNPSAGNWIAHSLPNHRIANDIGVGSDAYVTSTAGEIFKWNGSWVLIPGSALRIDCDESGHVWSVNSGYQISELTPSGWVNRSGIPAWDIGVGKGAVWAARTNNQVYKWNSTYGRWDLSVGGVGQKIAVDPAGCPWTVYNSVIYELVGSFWQPQNRATNIPMQDVAAMGY